MGILSTSRFHEEVIELPVLPVQDAVVKVLVHWDGIWKMEIQEDQVKYWYSLFPGVGRLRLENNLSAWMDEQYELWMGRKGRPLPPKYGRLIIHHPY